MELILGDPWAVSDDEGKKSAKKKITMSYHASSCGAVKHCPEGLFSFTVTFLCLAGFFAGPLTAPSPRMAVEV